MLTFSPVSGFAMTSHLDNFLERLRAEPAVLVTVSRTKGSVPREPGAWMAVFAQGVLGTIGGGHLEWEAQQIAQTALLAFTGMAQPSTWERTVPLGPSLGQCCGGVVVLHFEVVTASQVQTLRPQLEPRRWPLALFGGGHVGRAIVNALAVLPFQITWVDSRDEVFPVDLPAHVQTEHSDPVQAAVRELPAGTRVLIMSFSHAEDLEVVIACLQRIQQGQDLPFVGLIGSRTKWATFSHRLRERGFDETALSAITCPIGIPGIRGKEPEVIAASVAAQLLLDVGRA
jgi:xanthine dehydrogenase accessory factor